jgi:hypothetical protein
MDCIICGSNYEDNILVHLECPNVVQVWRDVNLCEKIDRILRQNYNIDVVVFSFLHQLSTSQSEFFCHSFMEFMEKRNLKLWRQKNETNMQVLER